MYEADPGLGNITYNLHAPATLNRAKTEVGPSCHLGQSSGSKIEALSSPDHNHHNLSTAVVAAD